MVLHGGELRSMRSSTTGALLLGVINSEFLDSTVSAFFALSSSAILSLRRASSSSCRLSLFAWVAFVPKFMFMSV